VGGGWTVGGAGIGAGGACCERRYTPMKPSMIRARPMPRLRRMGAHLPAADT